MEPDRNWRGRATLVDLLDRVFDKGVVLYADVVISVAGIPLIGVNLRAALAGMETMVEYGIMQDMDIKTRMLETQHRKKREVSFIEGEELILKIFGSYHYKSGIYNAWKSGQFYLTNTRLLLYQKDFDEVVFETPVDRIRAITVRSETSFTGKMRDIIYLYLQDKKVVRISVLDTQQFLQKLEHLIDEAGITLDEEIPSEALDERAHNFLIDGEKIFCKGKMWHCVRESGILGETWKPGYLYITNKRLVWWYEFASKIVFQIPVEKISAAVKERRDLSTVLKDQEVLDVVYSANGTKVVASFSGKREIDEWEKAINKVIVKGSQTEEEKETCPQCGKLAPAEDLLEEGCLRCGWTSPRQRGKLKIKNE
ncbi:MAG: gas vesicle protein [Candidatus Aminicenantes bacterium]|nr:gas vesicle protein [Candidatus Aminicenantes bacterium]